MLCCWHSVRVRAKKEKILFVFGLWLGLGKKRDTLVVGLWLV